MRPAVPAGTCLVLAALCVPGLAVEPSAAPSPAVVHRQTVSAPTAWASCSGDGESDREHLRQASEPAAAVDPRRTDRAIAVWMQDFSVAQPVARGVGSGARWTEPQAPALSGCTGRAGSPFAVFDPQAAWSSDGSLLVSGVTAGVPSGIPVAPLTDNPFVREVVAARSTDGGRSFGPPVVLRSSGTEGVAVLDRDLLTADLTRPGIYWAAWTRIDGLGAGSAVEWARSGDGGRTWSPAAELTRGLGGVVLGTGLVSVDDQPVALVVEAGPQPAALAGAFVGGSTLAAYAPGGLLGWERRATVAALPGFPETASLAADPDGTLFAAWATGPTGTQVSRSHDGGRTWVEPVTVEAPGGAPEGATVAAAADGSVAVLWYSGPSEARTVRVALSTDGGTSFPRSVLVDGPFDLADTPATNGAGGRALGDYFALLPQEEGWLAVYATPPGPGDAGQTGVVRAAAIRP